MLCIVSHLSHALCTSVVSSFRAEYCLHRYMRGLQHKPKRLPMSFWGWILPVYRTDEDEMIRVAGFDAATYMRIITFGEYTPSVLLYDMRQSCTCDLPATHSGRFWPSLPYMNLLLVFCAGVELFTVLTFLCCAAVLPVNLVVGPTVLLHPEPGTPHLQGLCLGHSSSSAASSEFSPLHGAAGQAGGGKLICSWSIEGQPLHLLDSAPSTLKSNCPSTSPFIPSDSGCQRKRPFNPLSSWSTIAQIAQSRSYC